MADDAGESKQELVEDRTEWAHRRTLLAKVRSFARRVRTGLSAVAVGFGAAQLLTDLEPQWLVTAASAALIVVGLGALLFGFWSYRETLRELQKEGVRGISIWRIGGFNLSARSGGSRRNGAHLPELNVASPRDEAYL